MADLPVIITCTQPRADTIIDDLAQKNISAIACPLLSVTATDIPCPQGDFDLILLTSGNAVFNGQDMPDLPVVAVGETTAETVRAHGYECLYTGQGTMADTMASPQLRSARHILYPCGVHRSKDTDKLLKILSGKVTLWPVYETNFNHAMQDRLHENTESLIVLFSVRGAESFIHACQRLTSTHSFSVLCLSAQIADVIRDIPLKNLAVCPRPDYDCLSEMIVDLAKTEGQNNGNHRTSERNR